MPRKNSMQCGPEPALFYPVRINVNITDLVKEAGEAKAVWSHCCSIAFLNAKQNLYQHQKLNLPSAFHLLEDQEKLQEIFFQIMLMLRRKKKKEREYALLVQQFSLQSILVTWENSQLLTTEINSTEGLLYNKKLMCLRLSAASVLRTNQFHKKL